VLVAESCHVGRKARRNMQWCKYYYERSGRQLPSGASEMFAVLYVSLPVTCGHTCLCGMLPSIYCQNCVQQTRKLMCLRSTSNGLYHIVLHLVEGSRNAASLSERFQWGEPGGRAPLLVIPKDVLSKALEMDVCFHRGPTFGEHGGTLLS
jgi:hypothetical protein